MASSEEDHISVRTENSEIMEEEDSNDKEDTKDAIIEEMELLDKSIGKGLQGVCLDFDQLPRKNMRQLYRDNKLTNDPIKLE